MHNLGDALSDVTDELFSVRLVGGVEADEDRIVDGVDEAYPVGVIWIKRRRIKKPTQAHEKVRFFSERPNAGSSNCFESRG